MSPTLACGTALAVLVETAAATPAQRDAAATAALRAASGESALVVARRPSGRPHLAPPLPELGVSLAHRDGLLLAGFSRQGAVGVDLERPASGLDPLRLALDHYAPAECAAIARLGGPAAMLDVFYRLWVAKEAALKATGRGIYDGVDEPDLHRFIAALAIDGGPVTISAGVRVPALCLAVARISPAQGEPFYCALAVTDG